MRTCVIFNPAAKGNKARKFRRHLDEIGAQSALKLTTAPGDARRLAAEAVQEGFETVVAAGGDGTLNEVLNGLGDVAHGFEQARLGVLPLGTVNVFAREMGLPRDFMGAWATVRAGREVAIDLPQVEFGEGKEAGRRFFAQLAGAGLDARAIELVKWEIKKKIGPFAYVLAGLQALAQKPAKITVSTNGGTAQGGLVLIGNGGLYGGDYRIFPGASMNDGLLDVCVFPKVTWLTLGICGPSLLLRGRLPRSTHVLLRSARVTLTGSPPASMEVDGEWAGKLPASFSVRQAALRVCC